MSFRGLRAPGLVPSAITPRRSWPIHRLDVTSEHVETTNRGRHSRHCKWHQRWSGALRLCARPARSPSERGTTHQVGSCCVRGRSGRGYPGRAEPASVGGRQPRPVCDRRSARWLDLGPGRSRARCRCLGGLREIRARVACCSRSVCPLAWSVVAPVVSDSRTSGSLERPCLLLRAGAFGASRGVVVCEGPRLRGVAVGRRLVLEVVAPAVQACRLTTLGRASPLARLGSASTRSRGAGSSPQSSS